jgi:hypothetical protein
MHARTTERIGTRAVDHDRLTRPERCLVDKIFSGHRLQSARLSLACTGDSQQLMVSYLYLHVQYGRDCLRNLLNRVGYFPQ